MRFEKRHLYIVSIPADYDSFKEGTEHNIFSRECSAGALMDIGVYSIHTLLDLLGKPDTICGFSVMLRGEIERSRNNPCKISR